MISSVQGNLFDSQCKVLINPVNCYGVMGKGLALQFKNRYPERFFLTYSLLCMHKEGHLPTATHPCVPMHYTFVPGKLIWNVADCEPVDGHVVCCMATKDHWRDPSKIEWIRDGLVNLKHDMIEKGYTSVAIPKLGCGCGGLDWSDVKPIIEEIFADFEGVVEIYE